MSFFMISAACNRSLREKDRLIWFQILIECITTGLEVKIEMGCANGSLEHNKAPSEVVWDYKFYSMFDLNSLPD